MMKRLIVVVVTAVLAAICSIASAEGPSSSASFQIAVVPEPDALVGLAAGVSALGLFRLIKR